MEAQILWGDLLSDKQQLTDSQYDQLYMLMVFSGGLSFVFSLLVILSHAFLRKSRRRFNDPVFWLSWGEKWCVIEGMGNQFFNMASFFWVSCIAHQLYQVLCNDMTIVNGKFLVAYHLTAWGFPALTVIILLFLNQFETETGSVGWCWIEPGVLRFLVFYLPMFILIIFNCTAYIIIVGTVYGKYKRALAVPSAGEPSQNFARALLLWGMKASLYLVVFIGTRSGSSINRIHEFLHPNDPSYVLKMFHVFCSGIQGFLYALVYINNERVISRLQDACEPANQGFDSDYSYPYAESQFSEENLEDESLFDDGGNPWEVR